jgi:hypothetical protein
MSRDQKAGLIELLNLGRILKYIVIRTLELGPNSSVSGISSLPDRAYKMFWTLINPSVLMA